ncbi:hypothetical protein TKK_0006314 [Trichogramma kaykai]|uniref:Uncharacterized protein n=1 Tax=Trichogramma kaykai TaxID=54128 RepID=A0ABD2XEK8_9HYME
MADLADFNAWLKELHCPESHTSDHVKRSLHKGVLGLIWDDLPQIIRPLSEVTEVRKNILLYKLKHEPKDPLIQCVRNTVNLKVERARFDAKIKNAEKRWHKQELICRQKANLLEKKKAEKKSHQLKKNVIKIKNEQMLDQIQDCAKMQEICQNLMPPTVTEIPQQTIMDCLSLVSNYFGGPEKRKVWNRIAESLCPVKVQVLWNALLQARSYYTDFLIHLDLEENQSSSSKPKSNIDVGIAKIWSEHLDSVSKRFIYNGRMKNNEVKTMEYVQKIEEVIEKQRPELMDWLPLALEVKKLEVLQTELQKELESTEDLPKDNMLADDVLAQLIMEIKTMDSKIYDCVQEIQNAFGVLKTAGTVISKTRESLHSEMEKFQLLQTREETSRWSDVETELMIFHNDVEMEALRKIMLKGDIGSYKHLRTCYNQATTKIKFTNRSDIISSFPMLHMPIYYLVDFYKTYMANKTLTKRMNEEITPIQSDSWQPIVESPTVTVDSVQGLFELLRLASVANERTKEHSEEFERVSKAWSNQSLREVASKLFSDKTVHGATLDEWQKRFAGIVYVLQKSNVNVA